MMSTFIKIIYKRNVSFSQNERRSQIRIGVVRFQENGILRNIILVLSILSILVFPSRILADQIQIDQTTIQTKSKPISPTPTSTPTPILKSHPIIIKLHVLEDKTIPYLSLSISADNLVFSPLTPANPLTRNTTLSLNGTAANVFMYSDSPLQTIKKAIIPATTCDTGACSENDADIWQQSLTYGFGYHIDSLPQNSYKQLPQNINKYIEVLALDQTANRTSTNLLYKINIPTAQAAGEYNTTSTYLAIPEL
ncbi:MAG TPA: hypothetical protein VMR41_01450 [Patescibacteria group bacterium]|nr:hypothetical protein [Patescibacteria group bacterium]